MGSHGPLGFGYCWCFLLDDLQLVGMKWLKELSTKFTKWWQKILGDEFVNLPQKLHRNSHQHLEPKTTVVIHTCLTTPKKHWGNPHQKKIHQPINQRSPRSCSSHRHPSTISMAFPWHVHISSWHPTYMGCTEPSARGISPPSTDEHLDIFGAKKIRWQRPPDPCAQSCLDINVHQTCWYTDIYGWLLKCYEANIKQSSSHIYSCYSCLRLLGWFCCHQKDGSLDHFWESDFNSCWPKMVLEDGWDTLGLPGQLE